MNIENLRKNPLGLFPDQSDAVDQSSRKVSPAKKASPKQPQLGERVQEYYEDMVSKLKDAEEATTRWRSERDLMTCIKSPTNAPQQCNIDGNYVLH